MKRIRSVSILGVSIAGGVFHNVGQLLAAALMVETYGVFFVFACTADLRTFDRICHRVSGR